MRPASPPSRPTTRPCRPIENSKADYDSSVGLTASQKKQLDYYQIRAPFAGIIGDIPVHLGDYVATTTVLTTVDENADLEAYIYIPTERAAQVRTGPAGRDRRQRRHRAGEVQDQLPLAAGG